MKCPIRDKEFSPAETRRTYCSRRCLKIKLDSTTSRTTKNENKYRGLRAKRAEQHIIPEAELDRFSFHTEQGFLESDTYYRRMYATGERA